MPITRVFTFVLLLAIVVSSTGCIANMGELKTALGVVPPAAPLPTYAAPHAKAQANATVVKLGAPVLFAASDSKDPQDLPLSYLWTFADGTSAATPEATHAYAKPGEYKVILTVTNEKGLADSDSVVLQVGAPNHAPTAALVATDDAPVALALATGDGVLHVMAGDKVSFDSTGSADPDGDALLASWDFGDGQSGVGPKLTHAYAEPGRVVAKLRVTDAAGASSEATRTLAVSWKHDESGSFDPTGDATKSAAFPVAAGARSLVASITYTPSTPVDDLSVAIVDATGKEQCHSAVGMPAPGSNAAITRSCPLDAAKIAALAPGAWKALVIKNGGVNPGYALSLTETL